MDTEVDTSLGVMNTVIDASMNRGTIYYELKVLKEGEPSGRSEVLSPGQDVHAMPVLMHTQSDGQGQNVDTQGNSAAHKVLGVKGEELTISEVKEEVREIVVTPDANIMDDEYDDESETVDEDDDSLYAILEAKKIILQGIEFVLRDNFDDLTGEIPSGKQVFERYLSVKRKYKRRKSFPEMGSVIRKELLVYWRCVLQREPSRINTTRMIKCMVDCFTAILQLQTDKMNAQEDAGQRLLEQVDRMKKLIYQPFDISLPHERGMPVVKVKTDMKHREELKRFFYENPGSQDLKNHASTKKSVHKALKTERTLNYYDDRIGRISNRDYPTPLEFATSLLRELMLSMHPVHPYRKKVELASLILHLSSRLDDFSTMYQYYTHLETEVEAGNLNHWRHMGDDFLAEIEEFLLDSANYGSVSFNPDLAKKSMNFPEEVDDKKPVEHKKPVKQAKKKKRKKKEEPKDDDFYYPEEKNGDSLEDFEVNQEQDEEENEQMYTYENQMLNPSNQLRPGRRRKYIRHKPYKSTRFGKTSWKRCEQCSYSTKTDTDLAKHMFNEHSHGTLCTICGFAAKEFEEYETHMKGHVLNCEECHKPLLGTKALRLHVSKYHGDMRPSEKFELVPCTVCGKMFRSNYLTTHLRNMHPETPKDYPCKLCDFVTSKQSLLKLHVQNIHIRTAEPCPICHKKFKEVRKHLLFSGCGGGPTQELTCDECGRKFRQKQTLKKHITVVHKNVKDKMCDQCEYRTYSAFNLRLHKAKVHTKVSLTTVCQICNEKTHSIEWHMKVYHPKMLVKPAS